MEAMPGTSAKLFCFAQAPDHTWHDLNPFFLNIRVQYDPYNLTLTAVCDAAMGSYAEEKLKHKAACSRSVSSECVTESQCSAACQ